MFSTGDGVQYAGFALTATGLADWSNASARKRLGMDDGESVAGVDTELETEIETGGAEGSNGTEVAIALV